jgi:hypothetical protein
MRLDSALVDLGRVIQKLRSILAAHLAVSPMPAFAGRNRTGHHQPALWPPPSDPGEARAGVAESISICRDRLVIHRPAFE